MTSVFGGDSPSNASVNNNISQPDSNVKRYPLKRDNTTELKNITHSLQFKR